MMKVWKDIGIKDRKCVVWILNWGERMSFSIMRKGKFAMKCMHLTDAFSFFYSAQLFVSKINATKIFFSSMQIWLEQLNLKKMV